MSDDTKGPFAPRPYAIGYGKPPASSRFVKGKSGNPGGRAKRAVVTPSADTSTRDLYLDLVGKPVKIRDGDNPREISTVEAIIRSTFASALKGNPYAQKNALERTERYSKERNVEIKENHDFWRKYSELYAEVVPRMQKAGESIPEAWPHPEDLIFEEGSHVVIRGGDPIEAAQSRNFRLRLIDVFILQAEKDRRRFGVTLKTIATAPVSVAEFLVIHINSSLPKRLQFADIQLMFKAQKAGGLPKREIDRRLRHAWAELGLPEARNLVTPPMESLLAQLGIERRKSANSPRCPNGDLF